MSGRASDFPDETTSLAFAAQAPADLPEVLEDAIVQRVDADRYRISSGPREWLVTARACHLHRDVSAMFYRAVPPRQAPWAKRFFWRAVLAVVSHPAGKRLLLALRGR